VLVYRLSSYVRALLLLLCKCLCECDFDCTFDC